MNNKKILLAIAAIIVIVVIAILISKSPKTQVPAEIGENEDGTGLVTSEKVNQELESIDSGDVEGELKDIDEELKNL